MRRTILGWAGVRPWRLVRRTEARAGTDGDDEQRRMEARRRQGYFDDAAAETPYLAVQSGEETFFVATGDSGVSRALFTHGWRSDQRILAQVLDRLTALGVALPAEPVFVEVGANIGTTTIVAVRRHGFSSAVAVEASPDNFRLLRINLVANGIDDRVRTIAAAAHDSEGELDLDVTSRQRGSHRISKAPSLTRRGKIKKKVTVPVRAITLDGLVAQGAVNPASVGLLWIDAPKHEANVLLGASAFIDAGVPIVTAIRVANRKGDPHRPWDVPPETKERVLERLTAAYTNLVVLRWETPLGETLPISELRSIVDSFSSTKDVLIVRRGGAPAAASPP
jgi:FkbM family methyltransferase